MPCSYFRITNVADDLSIIKFFEFICQRLIPQEKLLALVTPSLKVIRVGTILYETKNTVRGE